MPETLEVEMLKLYFTPYMNVYESERNLKTNIGSLGTNAKLFHKNAMDKSLNCAPVFLKVWLTYRYYVHVCIG